MSAPGAPRWESFDAQSVVVIVCSSVGLSNALELLLLIFTTFKHYSGLYFWSILIASFGVIPYAVGWIVTYFNLTYLALSLAINNYGWWTMVTGQSVVLYSRLHLVLKNPNILRAVKWMIIVDAILFHISTTIVTFGKNIGNDKATFSHAWNILERVQMTGFCIQEFIISGLYVWKTVELLKVVKKPGTIRVMWHLFIINIIIIAMDIGLLTLEYCDLPVMEQAFKVVTYSVKLKLEFAILNQLVDIVHHNPRQNSGTFSDMNEYVDEPSTGSDVTRFASNALRTNSVSKPQWLEAYERSNPFNHVEDIKTEEKETVKMEKSSDIESEPKQTHPLEDSICRLPEPARTRTMSDSDFMYAEAMRSVTASSKH